MDWDAILRDTRNYIERILHPQKDSESVYLPTYLMYKSSAIDECEKLIGC